MNGAFHRHMFGSIVSYQVKRDLGMRGNEVLGKVLRFFNSTYDLFQFQIISNKETKLYLMLKIARASPPPFPSVHIIVLCPTLPFIHSLKFLACTMHMNISCVLPHASKEQAMACVQSTFAYATGCVSLAICFPSPFSFTVSSDALLRFSCDALLHFSWLQTHIPVFA